MLKILTSTLWQGRRQVRDRNNRKKERLKRRERDADFQKAIDTTSYKKVKPLTTLIKGGFHVCWVSNLRKRHPLPSASTYTHNMYISYKTHIGTCPGTLHLPLGLMLMTRWSTISPSPLSSIPYLSNMTTLEAAFKNNNNKNDCAILYKWCLDHKVHELHATERLLLVTTHIGWLLLAYHNEHKDLKVSKIYPLVSCVYEQQFGEGKGRNLVV